jgi:hypothetical protein
MEIAIAKFPFPSEAMNSYFDMMQYITLEQSPTLPTGVFSEEFRQFCSSQLIKDPDVRPTPSQLLVSLKFKIGFIFYEKRHRIQHKFSRLDR